MSSKRAAAKEQRKQEYVIQSPKYFGGREIGITRASESSKVVGRTIKVSLYQLTDDFSKQYLLIKFKVVRVADSTAETMFYGHEYGREYLRSLVRRGSTRIDGIYNLQTRDGFGIRVQSTVFAPRRVRSGKRRAVRHVMKEILEEAASRLTLEQFSQELVLGKTASDIYNAVKKILLPRHVGVIKSKITSVPAQQGEVLESVAVETGTEG